MILDARTLPRRQDIIETGICIVGTGPAGLVVASELAAAGIEVTLLESGGLSRDADVQDLNRGYVTAESFDDLRKLRHRQVGGTTNIWNTELNGKQAAKYVPLDPIDFEQRIGQDLSGWPFGFGELEPWYRRAQEICGLGPFEYDAASWVQDGARPFRFDETGIESRVYQFGLSAPFEVGLIPALCADGHVSLIHNATVTGLLTAEGGGRVSAASVAVPGRDRRVSVRASRFVLAAGALENARLLLLSGGADRQGLANEHGLVGRCFMEHPRDFSMRLRPPSSSFFAEAAFYDQREHRNGSVVMGRLALSEALMRDEGLLQASLTLLPGSPPPSLASRITRKLGIGRLAGTRPGYPQGRAGWSDHSRAGTDLKEMRLLLNLEQAPSLENRVVLGNSRDRFGSPRIELHWRWTGTEQNELRRVRRLFADAFESAGYGSVAIEGDRHPDPNAHHHAGTTRMHDDPGQGVVDSDCRAHSVENLYIGGASVFPTAGFANPMLTIVALSARLGAHLRREITSEPE